MGITRQKYENRVKEKTKDEKRNISVCKNVY